MCRGANISCWLLVFFLLRPPPPRLRPLFAPETEPAADRLAALFSRAELCNHLDSVACSIYPSIQDYCTTQSVWFWKLSNLSNTDTISGGSVIGRIQRGLVFMEYTVIRASSTSNNKLLFLKTKTTFWFPSKVIICLINTKLKQKSWIMVKD